MKNSNDNTAAISMDEAQMLAEYILGERVPVPIKLICASYFLDGVRVAWFLSEEPAGIPLTHDDVSVCQLSCRVINGEEVSNKDSERIQNLATQLGFKWGY